MNVIDLFCGAGGLTLGLKQAGLTVIASNDISPLSITTYNHNHPDTMLFEGDISEMNPAVWLSKLGLRRGELDILAGCPPCQGFSSLRTLNGKRTTTDARNDLIFQFMRFVEALLPRGVLLENVPGLAKDARLDSVKSALNELGYTLKAEVLDAQHYNVPQRRKRFVMLATRAGKFVDSVCSTQRVTVRQAISGLCTPGEGQDPLHDYHEARQSRIADLIRHIPKDGGSRRDLPQDKQLGCHQRCEGFYDIYGRMAWDRPAPTITTGCINPSKGRFLHPEENRAITLREAAILQGFPPDYYFSLANGRHKAAVLIGNAFPPPFARAHAEVLVQALGMT